jgi:hypothetical protein
MPLTVVARVRSQASLVTSVVLKVAVGGFCYSTSVLPHQYHATDAPHSPSSSGRSIVTLRK